jgi:hypothetical protein
MTADFERLLLNHVAPHLQPLGYAYDAQLRLGDELFGFRKGLGADIHAIVQFRYREDAGRHDFTVNLFTAKSDEIRARLYDGYPGARGARLSYVMWFVHGLRDYAVPDYWWAALDEAYLPAALEEATGHIVRYGIPWLESAEATRPWEMPQSRLAEFGEAIEQVMTQEMAQAGYRLQRQSLAGDLPYYYFSKALADGTYALIEMQAIYSLDPSEFHFDVRLQRRADGDPLAFGGNYAHWRSVSLTQLVWQTQGGAPFDQLSVSEVKTLFWHYRDRAELDTQLQEALAQIKQIGCAWVEQAAQSKMIQ